MRAATIYFASMKVHVTVNLSLETVFSVVFPRFAVSTLRITSSQSRRLWRTSVYHSDLSEMVRRADCDQRGLCRAGCFIGMLEAVAMAYAARRS